MQTVLAIFENGVFRPIQPVQLPEQTEVEMDLRIVAAATAETNGKDATANDKLQAVYAILSERYASGHSDTAARHNEHQP